MPSASSRTRCTTTSPCAFDGPTSTSSSNSATRTFAFAVAANGARAFDFTLSAQPGYRFQISNRHTGDTLVKTDPYARGFELRPGSAACVMAPSAHRWDDADWLARRVLWDWQRAPVNIYEVHAGSWMRHPDGRPYLWHELGERLIPYAVAQG